MLLKCFPFLRRNQVVDNGGAYELSAQTPVPVEPQTQLEDNNVQADVLVEVPTEVTSEVPAETQVQVPQASESFNPLIFQLEFTIQHLRHQLEYTQHEHRQREQATVRDFQSRLDGYFNMVAEGVNKVSEIYMNWERQRTEWQRKRADDLERKLLRATGGAAAAAPEPENPEVRRPAKPTCQICFTEFNGHPNQTPRVLQCGHTICEICAMKIYVADPAIDFMKCPFDRSITALNSWGPLGLPKNYTVMEIMDQ